MFPCALYSSVCGSWRLWKCAAKSSALLRSAVCGGRAPMVGPCWSSQSAMGAVERSSSRGPAG
eukprot:4735569-Prorocentrum_lima.AAC.1